MILLCDNLGLLPSTLLEITIPTTYLFYLPGPFPEAVRVPKEFDRQPARDRKT